MHLCASVPLQSSKLDHALILPLPGPRCWTPFLSACPFLMSLPEPQSHSQTSPLTRPLAHIGLFHLRFVSLSWQRPASSWRSELEHLCAPFPGKAQVGCLYRLLNKTSAFPHSAFPTCPMLGNQIKLRGLRHALEQEGTWDSSLLSISN